MQHAGERQVVGVDLATGALPETLRLAVAPAENPEVVGQGLEIRRVVGAGPLQGVQFVGVQRALTRPTRS